MLKVSLILPVNRGGKAFKAAAARLSHLTPFPYEVLIILDGNRPDDRAIAETIPNCHIFSLDERKGPATARNFAAARANGDILLFLDADVIPKVDIIQQVETFHRTAPEVAAFFGSYDDKPTEKNLVSKWKNLFHHYVHQNSKEEASTFWTGCGSIRKTVFLSIGGFNEQFSEPSVEDIELGYRLKREGYRIQLKKHWQVTHLKRWSLFHLVQTDIFRRAAPWSLLIFQGFEKIYDELNLDLCSRFSGFLSLISIPFFILSLATSSFWSLFLIPILGSVIILNHEVYFFFYKKQGATFALCSIALHWLYYVYSTITFLGVGLSYTLLSDMAFAKFNTVPAPIPSPLENELIAVESN